LALRRIVGAQNNLLSRVSYFDEQAPEFCADGTSTAENCGCAGIEAFLTKLTSLNSKSAFYGLRCDCRS